MRIGPHGKLRTMADKQNLSDTGSDEPNLELPSLSLGFRRKKKAAAKQAEAPVAAESPAEAVHEEEPAEAPEPVAAEAAPAPAEPIEVAEAPLDEAPAEPTPVEPTPVAPAPPDEEPAAVAADEGPEAVVEPVVDEAPRPEATTAVAPIAEEPAATSAVTTETVHPEETTAVLLASAATTVAEPDPAPDEIAGEDEPEGTPYKEPAITGRLAAIVTGLLMGLVGVVLAWAAAQGCEAVRGVGSCGGFGLFALIAILAIEVLLGAMLLRMWRVADPTSTSFLGVGLVAVMAMLFFLDHLESRWMLVVIPVLTALSYLISWWVTETLIQDENEALI